MNSDKIKNLSLKIPLKRNVISELDDKSINLIKKIHSFEKTKKNEEKKLMKLKKIFVFVYKLKQILLNPYAYNKI